MDINGIWSKRVLDAGADFVRFVDAGCLPGEAAKGYACAVIFGRRLSAKYINAIREGGNPKPNEFASGERKMDALSEKLAGWLGEAGYASVGKLKTGLLPHKTVALRAGLGFIGKNNLLITEEYGCALTLGRVLTTAPFITETHAPKVPECGACNICVEACPGGALLGKTWELGVAREEILNRKNCSLCLMCMAVCPYTVRYYAKTSSEGADGGV